MQPNQRIYCFVGTCPEVLPLGEFRPNVECGLSVSQQARVLIDFQRDNPDKVLCVTTNSPLVLMQCVEGQAYTVVAGKPVLVKNPGGRTVADTLVEVFGLDPAWHSDHYDPVCQSQGKQTMLDLLED